MKVYRCTHCQEISVDLINHNLNRICCDDVMEEIKPNLFSEEADNHQIHVRKIGNFVMITIGQEEHPMLDIHHISWVILQTDKGIQFKELRVGDPPIIDFLVYEDEEIVNVYAFCTVHSLWSLN